MVTLSPEVTKQAIVYFGHVIFIKKMKKVGNHVRNYIMMWIRASVTVLLKLLLLLMLLNQCFLFCTLLRSGETTTIACSITCSMLSVGNIGWNEWLSWRWLSMTTALGVYLFWRWRRKNQKKIRRTCRWQCIPQNLTRISRIRRKRRRKRGGGWDNMS